MARDPPGAQEVVSITGENELGTSLELGSTEKDKSASHSRDGLHPGLGVQCHQPVYRRVFQPAVLIGLPPAPLRIFALGPAHLADSNVPLFRPHFPHRHAPLQGSRKKGKSHPSYKHDDHHCQPQKEDDDHHTTGHFTSIWECDME
ncbi:hypothetical protein DAPPUDRAFT_251345 [Daphnia pulex]|uniref:Uncharacterized protein n=1 Tax=Daphnia pulex TaxID=6669 RepID=E9H076_DAPPU|nr:hypothetical protein DAPPUDRAFT_251345 [Daphnia pulex]|eukprot:EFX74751.1 hypothetical protein DAPPUDRAFT_251345 [Daphnia pulex]